ncbi:ATP-binding protein [Pedobacter agri]|uniref:ATP-binding protein n=1 Tax=Pedobacter agri TaxID=454586 RepID=UPI00292FA11A|nr:ATP-binding protein [Pedobacter agri]
MNIVEKIKNINDRGLLERISIDILRQLRPEYANIIHGGINSQGETIVSPLDAFLQLPNGDFVLFEVSSDDSNLRKKWLDKTNGDVIKAAKKAEEWRSKFPDSKFTLWLCTNQRIKDDKYNRLFSDTILFCKDNKLHPEFLEQSAIVAYLEDNPNGQWLAQKHLEIKAVRLSVGKLEHLQEQNQMAYEREIYLNRSKLVKRNQLNELSSELVGLSRPLLLVGKSGVGKSTLAATQLSNWKKDGQYGLRIGPEIIEKSISLLDSIKNQLNLYQSNLIFEPNFFFETIRSKILIVIDDINKSADPLGLLERVFSWQTDQKFIVVIPVWQNVYDNLPSKFTKGKKSDQTSDILCNKLFLGTYDEQDALTVIEGSINSETDLFSNQQIKQIAQELSYDPFLIEIYTELENIDQENWLGITQDPVEEFIKQKLSIIEHRQNIGSYQLYEALNELGRTMLQSKKLQISIPQLQLKISSQPLAALYPIAKEHLIFSIDTNGLLIFRHDKIRDFLLSKTLLTMATDIARHEQILSDPYYAELMGKAIGNFTVEEIDNKLEWFIQNNPLAVAESLTAVRSRSVADKIADKINGWYQNRTLIAGDDDEVISAVQRSISNIINPVILKIIKGMKPNIFTLKAGFLNGDTISAMRYFGYFENSDFEPSHGNKERDRLVENFRSKFLETGIADLKKHFADKTYLIKQKNIMILMSGYLKSPDLLENIYECWQSAKEELLTSTIWAMVNCYHEDKESLLQVVFDFWKDLEAEESDHGYPQGTKNLSSYHVGRCKIPIISSTFIDFLLLNAKDENNSQLSWCLICDIDDPKAINFVVNKLAKVDQKLSNRRRDRFYPAAFNLFNFSEKWNTQQEGKQMGQKSRECLSTIWRNKTKNDFLRKQAFTLWSAGVLSSDIPILATIIDEKDVLFRPAVIARLVLNDHSVLGLIKGLVTSESDSSRNWLIHLSLIWSDEVIEFIQSVLEDHSEKPCKKYEYSDSFILSGIADLLLYCPDQDVTRILAKHWDFLHSISDFLSLAFLTGTKEMQSLLAFAVPKYPEPKNALKYMALDMHSGLKIAHVGFKAKPITLQTLENMGPYLENFDHHVINEFVRLGANKELRSFIKDNVLPYSQEKEDGFSSAKELFPTDLDILENYKGYINDPKRRWQLEHWIEGLEKGIYSHDRLLELTYKHLVDSLGDENAILGFTEVLALVGKRKDVEKIDFILADKKYKNLYQNTRYKIYRKSLD